MDKILFFLEKYLAASLVLIMGATFRYNIRKPPPGQKVIYTFWHRNMIPLLYLHRKGGEVILISSSKDGELIAGPAEVLGFNTARGSSRRGGSKAVRQMIKLAADHSLAVTPDGPKGPRCQIKKGLLQLAYFTGLPILPIAVDIKQEKVFNSWDRFRVPAPFTRINVTYGDPIPVNSREDTESLPLVQQIMDKLTEENKFQ
ncbi:MAG: lysophospholipid acyltransferase family protein [Candidatus Cloacimonetes bacterium]|nr:lysophospholipid acyltransferase family protein [Candidatus Cloacimonadota bacterium]